MPDPIKRLLYYKELRGAKLQLGHKYHPTVEKLVMPIPSISISRDKVVATHANIMSYNYGPFAMRNMFQDKRHVWNPAPETPRNNVFSTSEEDT